MVVEPFPVVRAVAPDTLQLNAAANVMFFRLAALLALLVCCFSLLPRHDYGVASASDTEVLVLLVGLSRVEEQEARPEQGAHLRGKFKRHGGGGFSFWLLLKIARRLPEEAPPPMIRCDLPPATKRRK
jgi:hypothetical protein